MKNIFKNNQTIWLIKESFTCFQVSEHLELSNGKDYFDSSSLRYRSVVLEKVPLPSTGGNVVGKCISSHITILFARYISPSNPFVTATGN